MNPTVSSPRAEPAPLAPTVGREERENTGPGFSPSALLSTGGKPTAATAHLQAASPLQPRLKPFAHKATWKLMFLLVSLF